MKSIPGVLLAHADFAVDPLAVATGTGAGRQVGGGAYLQEAERGPRHEMASDDASDHSGRKLD